MPVKDPSRAGLRLQPSAGSPPLDGLVTRVVLSWAPPPKPRCQVVPFNPDYEARRERRRWRVSNREDVT